MKERKQSVSAVLCAVEKTIREHDLLRPKDRILVAVSGGPDSVALFHILLQLSATWRWALAVAHLHHGLRGRDADEDLAFVKQMAKEANLPFFDRKLPLGYLKRMRGSLQETARQERYRILEALRSEWKGHKIALGHQADDQTETVLAALLRGAGPKGLSGMPYERQGTLVRPILDLTRKQILRYLEACSIPFRQDPSNEDLAYRRNRIRHELLPMLRGRFNPRIDETLRKTASICAAANLYLETATDALWKEMAVSEASHVEISLSQYVQAPKALRYSLLRRAYTHLQPGQSGLSLAHLDALDGLTSNATKEEKWLHLPGGIRGVVGSGTLVVGKRESVSPGNLFYEVRFPGETHVRESNVRIQWEIVQGKLPNSWHGQKDVVYMDLGGFRGDAKLRSPISGDRMRPFGLGGTRKIQDILVDRHVPRRMRWRVPLLVDELGIAWVVGYCLDERVMIRSKTRQILRATLRPVKA